MWSPALVPRGITTNRIVEQSLHHGPVTGMMDSVLLDELRTVRTATVEELVTAQRAALQVSWRLHALVARRVPKL